MQCAVTEGGAGNPGGSKGHRQNSFQEEIKQDFPGGPGAKSPCSQGLDSIPGQGTRSHIPQQRHSIAKYIYIYKIYIYIFFFFLIDEAWVKRSLQMNKRPGMVHVSEDLPLKLLPSRCPAQTSPSIWGTLFSLG